MTTYGGLKVNGLVASFLSEELRHKLTRFSLKGGSLRHFGAPTF